MKIRRFIIAVSAFIAKKKLKRMMVPADIVVCRLGDSYILKAETKRVIVGNDMVRLEKYFSVHIACGPDKLGPGYQWWYEKYHIEEDGSYHYVRSGRYPYNWEK